MNQYFPNNQSMMLQNYAWIKDSFNVQDRPIDFNVTEYEDFWYGFGFHFATNH